MNKFFAFFSFCTLMFLLLPFRVSAIDGPARLKVGPTWLAAEIKGIKMVNSLCSIEMLLTNTSGKDYLEVYPPSEVTAYDDEGNQYIKYVIIMPNGRTSDAGFRLNLPADIPVKYTLQILGIKDEATTLKRVDWSNIIRLFDIPLNRE